MKGRVSLRGLFRLPVVAAVVGAFLNSGDLLATFQPAGRGWVGYVAAASVGLALLLSVEALLRRPSWVLVVAVVSFGLAEVSGQILHAALVRSDVVVMTPTLRWVMGYVSPSLVVIAGVAAAFVAHWGLAPDAPGVEPVTQADLAGLAGEVRSLADQVRQVRTAGVVPLGDVLRVAQKVSDPDEYVVDANARMIRRRPDNGGESR